MSDFDIYRSDLAKSQLAYDAEDYRRSLYTNTKPDHEPNPHTGGACDCERGDAAWERNGVAMKVQWPRRQLDPETRTPQRSRGRTR